MLPLWFLGLAACSGTSTTADSGVTGDSAASTGTTGTTGTDTTEWGCVSGRLRDSNNGSGSELQVDAWSADQCLPLGGTQSAADGTFCLDRLPVGEAFVLQATFSERCPWAHGQTVTIPTAGTCDVGDCAALDTWYECQGESASCP